MCLLILNLFYYNFLTQIIFNILFRYLLKDPKCVMPVTHITFLEPSDDPNNLCYLWVIQSDNSRLPNAMMIALTYEQRTMMSNGCLSYRVS